MECENRNVPFQYTFWLFVRISSKIAQKLFDSPTTATRKTGTKPVFLVAVRPGRIELPNRPWQGRVIPLNHGRSIHQYRMIILHASYLSSSTCT